MAEMAIVASRRARLKQAAEEGDKGAKTALIITEGFRDIYEIGRINRPESFNPRFRKHRPLVPREDIFEVTERMLADGSVRTPFDEREAHEVAQTIKEEGFEAVAVLFLHSYRAPAHEIRMCEILRETDAKLFLSASHELSREYREYERTSTVAANAYVGPKVSQYLGDLERRLREQKFAGNLMIMQSNGGLSDVDMARRQCIQMMESGPAGGVVGTMALCELLGLEAAIAFAPSTRTPSTGRPVLIWPIPGNANPEPNAWPVPNTRSCIRDTAVRIAARSAALCVSSRYFSKSSVASARSPRAARERPRLK